MSRRRILGELVTFKDASHFHHDGILYERPEHRTTIVHVHGSFGNFYQNGFLRVMAEVYLHAGINFLCFNLRGHDALAEGYRHEWDFEYAGGAITPFEACVDDIDAAVGFAGEFSERIVLQGHSLGCDRVLHYMVTKRPACDLILLSPCDSYQLQANWIAPETVGQQIERLRSVSPDIGEYDWLPSREYGIRQGDWSYSIPITRSALLSVMSGPVFELIRYDQSPPFYIDQQALIYLGGDDTLQTVSREAVRDYFSRGVRNVGLMSLHPEGDHSLWGCESAVSEEIVRWVNLEGAHQPRT